MALGVVSVMGLAWLYVVLRGVGLLPLGRGGKLAVALALLPLAEYYLLVMLVGGNLADVEAPRPLLVALGWAFGSFVLLALLLLARDLLAAVLGLLSRSLAQAMWRSGALTQALVASALLLGAWGSWQGLKLPETKRVDVTMPGLGAAFDGYRIAQLSDLHATRLLPADWQRAVVQQTNALQADLIVITGDLQDGAPAARSADVAPFAELHAPDGVLAVPGNHEYYVDYAGWMAAFKALGLNMLENRHVVIERAGAQLVVAGLTDPQAAAFGQAPPDLSAALAGAPRGAPVLVLAHRPGGAPEHARAGVGLQLSGHTHGGQILGVNLLTQWANRGFLAGLYQVGRMPLYVSRGTGLWHGLVLRLGAPSEITEVVLHAAR
ncbi:metallophosphoesterase [Comamonas sp. NLF-1-9]|uniref:metallophosphoesterase n=1 Tax=Comamonas sp. NLF-1-9 TaxID=2853163 RepID=UPI001C473AF6|nr:metallophosphoesterase [Comamonas sp. NLF-1-9]QXL83920.1 metallophosphoesterase [Comamonas sp. NLF-1-9]